MKFALVIATLALVSGIQRNHKDDINYDSHFDNGQNTAHTSYSNDKATRDAAVGAEKASNVWRGVKDPSIFGV